MVVIDQTDGAGTVEHYVNPEILARAAPGFVQESCLSVPGIVGNVWRSTKVKVRARDRFGRPFERELKGMHAVCMQHEIDHLEGKLFIDRLWFLRRLLVLRGSTQGRFTPRRRAKAYPASPEPDGPAVDARPLSGN